MHDVATKLRDIESQLNTYFLERREVIRAALLAILAGEHLFILGPPGTAKSDLIRTLVRCIVNARYFEVGLSKTRPAEAVLGPLNIKEFRDNGNYFLKREGYASMVEFPFFDEGGKMSPVLGHDLLMLLNERAYSEVNGGRSIHPSPLSSAFVASNEHITGESDDAAALWDRLVVRTVVDYLQDKGNFASLLTNTGGPEVTTTVEWDDLKKVIDVDVRAIGWSDDALKGVVKLRHQLRAEGIEPSDRRFKQSVKVMQASAFLDGRDRIEEEDLAVLRFTLWDTVEQFDKVERMCLSASNPFVEDMLKVRQGLVEVSDGINSRKDAEETQRLTYGREANGKLKEARTKLDSLLKTAGNRKIPGFREVAELHAAVLFDNYTICLGLDEDAAQVATEKKLGLGYGDDN